MYRNVVCKGQVFLQIGDVVFLEQEGKAWTTLGSCVSVCLYSKVYKVAAICHALLPLQSIEGGTCRQDCDIKCGKTGGCKRMNKFLDVVIPLMIRFFKDREIPVNTIQAAIVGGSSYFNLRHNLRGQTVGSVNVMTAKSLLKDYKIHVSYEDVGGTIGRKVFFDNSLGLFSIDKNKTFTFP